VSDSAIRCQGYWTLTHRVLLWTGAAVLGCLFWFSMVWQASRFQQRQQQWLRQQENIRQQVDMVLTQLDVLLRASENSPDGPYTQKDLEQRINNGKSFLPCVGRSERNGRHFVLFADPGGKWAIEIAFTDGRWTGYGTTGHGVSPLPPPPAVGGALESLVLWSQRWIIGCVVPLGWLSGVAVLSAMSMRGTLRPSRQIIADVLLSVAILQTFAGIHAPQGFTALAAYDRLRSPQVLLMLTVSGAVVIWFVRRSASVSDSPRCHACGYNLTGNVSGICPECGTGIQAGQDN
jgi:hypothetical protein